MSDYPDDYEIDPLDWPEFDVWCLERDIMNCCYLIQEIKCILRNSDLYGR
jgi:hypothetical protein